MMQSNSRIRLAVTHDAAHAAILEKPEACDRAILNWARNLRK